MRKALGRRLAGGFVLAAAVTALVGGLALAGSGGDAKIEATQFEVDHGNTIEEFARCGRGKRALGGGVVQSGAPDGLFVRASGPLDASGVTANTGDGDKAKRWYAAVHNDSGIAGRIFKVFAICSADSKATIEATEFTVDNSQYGEASVKCGRGERALGGGVVQSGSAAGLYVAASGPLDRSGITANTGDGDKAKRWYAAVGNVSGFDNRVFRVFAICSADSKAKIEATQFSIDAQATVEGLSKCGKGKRALGGGVVQTGSPYSRVTTSGPLDASGVTANTGDGDKAKRWYAALKNDFPADTRTFKVFAICE